MAKVDKLEEKELDEKVRKLNGRSAKKLRKCLKELEDAVDGEHKKAP